MSTSTTGAVETQETSSSVPRGAQVELKAVTHHYPLSRDLDRGWLHFLLRRLSPAAMARYEAEAVKPDRLPVLDDIDLRVSPGEFVSLVGPSGCGKSTILRLLAGLEQPVEGSVEVDSKPVAGPSPLRALAFQDATLLPWRTVRDNVALGPEARDRLKRDQRRVEAALQVVGLRDFAEAYPATLSGGMAQRASLARALVNRPRLFLMDEPLGKLDALTRLQLQDEIIKLWESQSFTAILVTHDVDEALRLADRVIVLSERPAHIVADIEVPEHNESTSELRELRRQILNLLGR